MHIRSVVSSQGSINGTAYTAPAVDVSITSCKLRQSFLYNNLHEAGCELKQAIHNSTDSGSLLQQCQSGSRPKLARAAPTILQEQFLVLMQDQQAAVALTQSQVLRYATL